MTTSGADDSLNVTAGAAIESTDFEAALPHFFIGDAVSTDNSNVLEIVRNTSEVAHIREIEINNDYVGIIALDMMTDFVDIARNYYVLEVGVKIGSKMFCDDAV